MSAVVFADYHTHSTLDDGESTLEEMALAACARGLQYFGFSGHSWCPWEEDFCLPRERAAVYLETARSLQRRFQDRLEIFVGMELDLYGERPEGLDYIIGSVHGLFQGGQFYSVDESPEASRWAVETAFGGDWYRYSAAYFDLTAQLPEKTGCNWIGHFDLVSKFNQREAQFDEEDPRYLNRALEALEYLAKRGMCFEVNTGAVARGYRTAPYPTKTMLRRLRELGGELILSSDAHRAAQLCGGFPEAAELLKEIGFTHVNIWTRDGFRAVGLED